MNRARPQYAVLMLVFLCAALYECGMFIDLFHRLNHGSEIPSLPLGLTMGTRTIGNGPFTGDQILAINGRPFSSAKQLQDLEKEVHPGDSLHLVLSEPSGRAIERNVRVESELQSDFPSAANIAIDISLFVLIPIVCLSLGFFVAFIRPHDGNAWLLLALLIGFSGVAGSPDWHRSFPQLSFFWEAFAGSSWAASMMLFAIYFPSRFSLDKRLPWLKYLILLPSVAAELTFRGITLTWIYSVDLALPWRPLLGKLYLIRLVFQMVGVGAFFAVLGTKYGMETSPDEKRRLRILRTGASISLSPMFIIVLYSLFRDQEVFSGVSWPIEVTALCMLSLFPLTLAYVIVVERAMDLSFVVRQSVKYGLAKGTLWVVRAAIIGLAIYVFRSHAGSLWGPLPLVAAVGGLAVIRKRSTEDASKWLDRKFFREAYNAEIVLSELAGEVGRYVEIDPLLETVARRISDTMHVPDIVILVREANTYVTRYSTRVGPPLNLPAGSRILSASDNLDKPLEVYLDKPQPWLQKLSPEELQALSFMRSELLLVLRGRGSEEGQIIGIMSLGPKKSEIPYSKTDMRLLQTIAAQMGMALQNSRLAASLADETAHREVMNRELEIAREVQERLFPQKLPKIPGLDCWGYCRPARGVGGDYYDFIELPDGRLGIAIGDVSGKGIAAALLMASLQASLRGQTMAGVHDLAELMRNVNKLVYDASQSNRYATFFYGEFDPATRHFAYVNAGHNAPVILRGEQLIPLEACGPVVGLLPGVSYTMEICRMEPGDIFIGYTDGISEAQDEHDEEWEEDRFIAAARASSRSGAKQMIEAIFRSADAFTGIAKQYDDMTLLVVKLAA